MKGADMVIGWVRDGQVFFQDRHAIERSEPEVDSSQDYEQLLGYENGTHTVLRFRRKYDTCDPHDFKITNDTVRMLYAYHDRDPVGSEPLPYHGSQRGARSVFLLERVPREDALPRDTLTWDLRNPAVPLPNTEDTLYWCKIFKLPDLRRKHHMIRYEPIHQAGNRAYLHHLVVYECSGDASQFEKHVTSRGEACYHPHMPNEFLSCHNVVVTWAVGSEGFNFPSEAGYPLDPGSGAKYYMMETHYNNPNIDPGIIDSSGVRVFYTPTLRKFDAGVISVGLDPNWRHIIPPGRPEVVSEGHCIADCTRQALPESGINVFATLLHTHLIGRKVRFRQIRGGEELQPITADNNYDFNYQEYRRIKKPVKVYPGDHLIAECTYNSEARSTITLGGLTAREEMCLAFALYYPRVDLTLCYSLPSLPTVLHSLGIQELMPNSSPVKIKLPEELRDMTLETRLVTYDWEKHFGSFQDATRKGSFKPLCWAKKPVLLPGTEDTEATYPNITRAWRPEPSCHRRRQRPHRKKRPGDEDDDDDNETISDDARDNAVMADDMGNSLNPIGAQEQSRLNSAAVRTTSAAAVLGVVAALLVLR
ncbi:MOXD1 homolog 2 [Thrips palmi]|uniref:MOXD1 homolog 2 n=1 Tax=Thrips palmi TaxID=161013 RepID=A0A6P9A1F8_THRPL|nr:MOXD1 homolog 2 [Thrips palmi]